MKELAEKIGHEVEDPAAGIDPEVVELAKEGNAMRAAELYAERTGVDFIEAQRVVSGL